MKKKILISVAAVIFTLLICAMILAPPTARWYINKNGKELTGRRVYVDKIRINYGTFTFRIIGFKMFEKNDSTVFTGFDTLLVDLQPLKLIKSELDIKRLWLIDPVARITKKDTVFNFSDIIEHFSAPDTTVVADSSSFSSSGFKFKLSDIRLKHGEISYTDEDINNTTLLDDLSFTIPYLSWNQEESSQAGLKFNFRNGGYFKADGSFDPKSGDFKSNITVNNLDISQFASYIKPYIYLNNIQGLASCNMDISGNPEHTDSLNIKGHFSVESFIATDRQDRKIIGSDKLNVSLKSSLPVAGRFVFDTIELTKPYLMYEMHDSTNNFSELFPPEKPDTLARAGTDTISEPLFYSLNSFIIKDGVVDFTDKNLKDPFKYHFSQIKLNTDSFSSVSTWLKVYATMKLNEKGDLKADIGVNPSDPYELKVDYVIKNFQLPDFTPYSKFYLGSAIVYGNMYYAGKTSITAKQITSENKLIIRNAEIGKKSGGIFNLPLRLALYLIKDMHGDIKIDLPVTGDLNDPSIRIGKLLWTTFKNFIVKVAASPFIALSNLFGIDEKDIRQLDFEYADTTLSSANTRKLDQLLQIKEKKPELNVELAYFNDRGLEKEQIGYEEAGRIFKQQTGNDYTSDKEAFEAFLKKALVKDTIDLYKDCIKLAGPEKVSALSKTRDSLRISLVENYLRSKDTTGKIKIFIPNLETVKNEGSRPNFEVKFSMEE
jgi:hypothetical protein